MTRGQIADLPFDRLTYTTESISISIPERTKEKIAIYRSTYEFGSPRRYKSVIYLEPRLAPARYWRKINLGAATEFGHKSGVDCTFRPRPNSFSETAWIFPKQGMDVITSQLDAQILVDTHWYKSKINRHAQCGTMNDKVASVEKIQRNINGPHTKKFNSVGGSEDSGSDSYVSGCEEV